MKKEDAIRIITNCANDYHTYLENQNLLFLFGDSKNANFFEASFLPRHFLHLTGVKVKSENTSGSSNFYNRALDRRLSPDDFSFSANGTTEMKLLVLPQLMRIHISAKMIGEYNESKSVLHTDKLAGGISACLGFVQENGYYIPNTVLKEDIRNVSKNSTQRVLAIFRKQSTHSLYAEVCYLAKGITFDGIKIAPSIKEKIDFTAVALPPLQH